MILFKFFKNIYKDHTQKINVTTKSLEDFLKSKGVKNILIIYDHYVGTYSNRMSKLISKLNAKYVGNDNNFPIFKFKYNEIDCYLKCGDYINSNKVCIQTKRFSRMQDI